jgi:two-component system phosphate regulon sensor histidine kinase PhoR
LDIGFPFRCEPVPVDQVLRAICAHMESAARERNHSVITELAADLPPLMGDQKYLQLALRHLVENAIQYTPPGGTITIRAALRGEQVVIEVSDTGIGIAEEHQGAIFRRFFRVERARTERGAGLGLPIARAIIEQHGGSIEVNSTLDAGSTFRVFLPISGC